MAEKPCSAPKMRKKGGSRQGVCNVFVFIGVDLSCFYQSRSAGFAIGLRLAGHARGARRSGVVHGRCDHGDLRRDDRFEPSVG